MTGGNFRTAAVVNPRSANGRTGKEWNSLRSALEAELGPIAVKMTTRPLEAVELTRRAIQEGAEMILAVGGDGTLNEVVNGFFDNGRPVREGMALGVLSRGTGCDFIKSYGFPKDVREAARLLRGRDASPCDVGLVRLKPAEGAPAERYFINIADLGVGGLVVDAVNRTTKAFGGKASFLMGSIRGSLAYRNQPMRIVVDGKTVADGIPQYMVAVANGRCFGAGMRIAPDASLSDGQFEVVVTGDLTFLETVQLGRLVYRGLAGTIPKVKCWRGRRVEVSSPGRVLIDIDGELAGESPASFEIIPGALRLKGL